MVPFALCLVMGSLVKKPAPKTVLLGMFPLILTVLNKDSKRGTIVPMKDC